MADQSRPSDGEIDAAARILEREGLHHHWFPASGPRYDDMGPIEKSEFDGIVEQMLMAAAVVRNSQTPATKNEPK